MDSHTSLMVATFFIAMSALCAGLSDKYWKRNNPVALGPDQGCFAILDSNDSLITRAAFADINLIRSLTRRLPSCLHTYLFAQQCIYTVQCTAHGEASTRWCSVPTDTPPSSTFFPLSRLALNKIWLIFPFPAVASSTGSQLPINHLSQPNAWNASSLSPPNCCLGHKPPISSSKKLHGGGEG